MYQVDDSIPPPIISGDFYETFGPVFERNGRWSIKKPAPMLGDDSTDIQTVNNFYAFWLVDTSPLFFLMIFVCFLL